MRVQKFILLPTTVAMVAMFGITACGKTDEGRTVGQQIDSAVAKVGQKAGQAVAEAKKDVNSTELAAGKAIDTAKVKVKDASITTSINAELARDPNLSALKINVDTSAGRVALKGTAPDAAARDRATQLAQRVDGVVGVDNQLTIRSN